MTTIDDFIRANTQLTAKLLRGFAFQEHDFAAKKLAMTLLANPRDQTIGFYVAVTTHHTFDTERMQWDGLELPTSAETMLEPHARLELIMHKRERGSLDYHERTYRLWHIPLADPA